MLKSCTYGEKLQSWGKSPWYIIVVFWKIISNSRSPTIITFFRIKQIYYHFHFSLPLYPLINVGTLWQAAEGIGKFSILHWGMIGDANLPMLTQSVLTLFSKIVDYQGVLVRMPSIFVSPTVCQTNPVFIQTLIQFVQLMFMKSQNLFRFR